MKKENLSRVVNIDIELKAIDNKIGEINHLENSLKSPDFTVTLKVETSNLIITVPNTFIQTDLLSICQHRKEKLVNRSKELEKELEGL